MRIYRGTKDVFPSEIDHKRIADAVYGRGTYFGLSREVAERYLSPSSKMIQVLFHYDCNPKKTLRLNTNDVPKLNNFVSDESLAVTEVFLEKIKLKESNFYSPQLCSLAVASGYDAIVLHGQVEGGEQLIIPEDSQLEVIPILAEVCFSCFSEPIRIQAQEHLENDLGLKTNVVSSSNLLIAVSPHDLMKINDLLKFISELRNGFIYRVDFKKRAYELYEDDE
jgi:hypothetical protein